MRPSLGLTTLLFSVEVGVMVSVCLALPCKEESFSVLLLTRLDASDTSEISLDAISSDFSLAAFSSAFSLSSVETFMGWIPFSLK